MAAVACLVHDDVGPRLGGHPDHVGLHALIAEPAFQLLADEAAGEAHGDIRYAQAGQHSRDIYALPSGIAALLLHAGGLVEVHLLHPHGAVDGGVERKGVDHPLLRGGTASVRPLRLSSSSVFTTFKVTFMREPGSTDMESMPSLTRNSAISG